MAAACGGSRYKTVMQQPSAQAVVTIHRQRVLQPGLDHVIHRKASCAEATASAWGLNRSTTRKRPETPTRAGTSWLRQRRGRAQEAPCSASAAPRAPSTSLAFKNTCTILMDCAAASHARRAPRCRSRPSRSRFNQSRFNQSRFNRARIQARTTPCACQATTTAATPASCPAAASPRHAPPVVGPGSPRPAGGPRRHRDRPDRSVFLL
jgi:hypothetical protein